MAPIFSARTLFETLTIKQVMAAAILYIYIYILLLPLLPPANTPKTIWHVSRSWYKRQSDLKERLKFRTKRGGQLTSNIFVAHCSYLCLTFPLVPPVGYEPQLGTT